MTCGGAYGSGGAGSVPFGSGLGAGLNLAEQSALNAVDVTFSDAMVATDPATAWDVLRPSNWSLEPYDPHDSTIRLAQHAERLSAEQVRVLFDGRLDPDVVYRIFVDDGVLDATGAPIDPGCLSALFGTFRPQRRPPLPQDRQPLDIANPFMIKDADIVDPPPLSTFQATDQGDVAPDSGRVNRRKRIFRRLTTPEGGFAHLPDYGLAPEIKGLTRTGFLRELASKAREQIELEPDIARAEVSASSPEPGLTFLHVRAFDRDGGVDTFTVPLRDLGV